MYLYVQLITYIQECTYQSRTYLHSMVSVHVTLHLRHSLHPLACEMQWDFGSDEELALKFYMYIYMSHPKGDPTFQIHIAA